MKVLQEGTSKRWEIEQVCNGCNAVILLNEEDIYFTASTDFNGSPECFYTFECPCCGAENEISEQYIVPRVRNKAKKKYFERKK